MDWQPIETAKINDTFLAINVGSIERYDVHDPAAVVTVPCHNRAFICHSFEDEETGERCFIDELGEQYGLDGRVSDAEDLTSEDDVLRLTHWMPLPAPPKHD